MVDRSRMHLLSALSLLSSFSFRLLGFSVFLLAIHPSVSAVSEVGR